MTTWLLISITSLQASALILLLSVWKVKKRLPPVVCSCTSEDGNRDMAAAIDRHTSSLIDVQVAWVEQGVWWVATSEGTMQARVALDKYPRVTPSQ